MKDYTVKDKLVEKNFRFPNVKKGTVLVCFKKKPNVLINIFILDIS